MITQEQQKQGAELIKTLALKAWDSSAFKEQLINKPVQTIAAVTGTDFTLPEGQKLVVEDQTNESIIYLNIPKKVDTDSLELTDEQLEMVSGGDFLVACAIITVIGGAFWGGYSIGKDIATKNNR